MERSGFNSPNFETPGSESGDSKETTKSKKKKSAESAPAKPEVAKKELAEHGKSLWEKLVSDDKPEKPEKAAKAEITEEKSEEKAETADENDQSLEELTPAEDARITEQLVHEKVEELMAEADPAEQEVEAIVRQAALAALQELVPEAAEIEDEPDGESAPEHRDMLFGDEDEPLPFDDEPVAVAKRQPPAGGSAGSTPPQPPAAPRFDAATPNLAPSKKAEYEPDYRVDPNRTYLLVGGIVGYLIGRRRGRIKTEKRMNVVVKKLEKQVEAKQQIINGHVEAAKQKARQEYWAGKGRPEVGSETAKPDKADMKRESKPDGSATVNTERLAAPTVKSAETERKKPEAGPGQPEAVELRDEDIMRISETIKIGATNLKKIYEARLVSPSGLRRLVGEHLQGKDIRRGLAREFLAKELSFERDPRFRDILPAESVSGRAGAASVRAASVADLSESAVPALTPAKPQPQTSVTKIPVKRQRRVTVSSGALAILTLIALGLAAYAVILSLTR